MFKTVEYVLVAAKAHVKPGGATGDEILMHKGDTVETALPLDKMFPAKFERVDRTPVITGKKFKSGPKESVVEVKEDEPVAESKSEEPTDEKGDNVTAEYQLAVDNDLQVFYVSKAGFTIYDGGSPVNDKPLRSSREVTSKLKDYVGAKK